MTIYDTIRAAVNTGLSGAGLTSSLSYRKAVAAQPYDPRTEQAVAFVTETNSFDAVISSQSGSVGGVQYGKSLESSLQVRQGDLILLVNNLDLGFTFDPGGEVLIDSIWWKVIAIDPPYAGEQVVVFNVQVRRR